MNYSLLLRGINVGGKNRVVMAEFRAQLADLGLADVSSYINSGNLFFSTALEKAELNSLISRFLAEKYPFVTSFILISQKDYQAELALLPDWWYQEMARKDVLFYTDRSQKSEIEALVSQMALTEELVHFGASAIFWGKTDERSYSQTAYHKELIKQSFYKRITIRNHKTFAKIGEFLA